MISTEQDTFVITVGSSETKLFITQHNSYFSFISNAVFHSSQFFLHYLFSLLFVSLAFVHFRRQHLKTALLPKPAKNTSFLHKQTQRSLRKTSVQSQIPPKYQIRRPAALSSEMKALRFLNKIQRRTPTIITFSDQQDMQTRLRFIQAHDWCKMTETTTIYYSGVHF